MLASRDDLIKKIKQDEESRVWSGETTRMYLECVESYYPFLDLSIKNLTAPNTLHEDFIKKSTENLSNEKSNFALGLLHLGQVFTPAWCEKLLLELDNFQSWAAEVGLPIKRPNSMNLYGVILTLLGFDEFFDALIKNYLKPIASHVFPKEGGGTLLTHHAFTVEYRAGGGEGETELAFHVDDSDVTLNICLGTDHFEGGDLYFEGQRCQQHVNTRPKREIVSGALMTESVVFKHERYEGILHSGRNRHGARPVTDGRRVNLILWCRNAHHHEVSNIECGEWCALNPLLEGDWRKAYETADETVGGGRP